MQSLCFLPALSVFNLEILLGIEDIYIYIIYIVFIAP